MPPQRKQPVTLEAESIGELSRMLASFKTDTHDDLIAINARLDQLNFVTPEVYAADRHADTERHMADIARIERIEADLKKKADTVAVDGVIEDVKGIKSNSQWMWRTIVGGLILAAIGVVVAASGFPH